ncbi:MAG TPA: DinB family protein [Acidobacteriaceae bacterium]|jgi:uncharacterized damage-inducible protein DinB|nr:DinB family protein [Acidobacteriaceae bacterium]
MPQLSAEEVVAWLEKTSSEWRALLEQHPELLLVTCDIAGTRTVGGVLQHIVAVELRYAERLAGLPATDYRDIPFDSVIAIYATHDRAMQLFEQELAGQQNWDERIDFVTRTMGPARASRRAVLFHAMLHSIRHYAQLATLVRHTGVKPGWPMDYLFMDMELVGSTSGTPEQTKH